MKINLNVLQKKGFHVELNPSQNGKLPDIEIYPEQSMNWEEIEKFLSKFEIKPMFYDYIVSTMQESQILSILFEK